VNEDVGQIYKIKISCISARYYVKRFMSTFSILECCILYIRNLRYRSSDADFPYEIGY